MLKPLLDFEAEAPDGSPERARPVNAAYVYPVQSVLSAVEKYSSHMGRPALLEAVVAAMSIRAANLARSTIKLELCAMRQFSGHMLERRVLAGERGENIVPWQVVPENLNAPEWIIESSWSEFERLSADLKNSKAAELFELGLLLGNEAIDREALGSGLGANPGVLLELGNIKRAWPVADARRKPKPKWEKIGKCEVEVLLEKLPSRCEEFGIATLAGNRVDIDGIAKLLAKVCWLTGMRAVEVFSCRLLVSALSANSGVEGRNALLSDPIGAFRLGNLAEVEVSRVSDCRELQADLLESTALTGVPSMLLIETAKTACSSPNIDNRQRIQILEGVSSYDLGLLCLASKLRRFALSPQRIATIRTGCSKKIKLASLDVFPDRCDPITLHYFRHAFADAARRLLTVPQVAALMGHTSRETANGYGGKFVRRSKFASGTRWLPKHDPKQADILETAWRAKPDCPMRVIEPQPSPPEI